MEKKILPATAQQMPQKKNSQPNITVKGNARSGGTDRRGGGSMATGGGGHPSPKSCGGFRRGSNEKNFSKNATKLQTIAPSQQHAKSSGGGGRGSADHLLNFHYAPMRGSVSSLSGYSSSSVASSHRSRHKVNTFNKQAYLHAKCTFVVRDSPTTDYAKHSIDPDMVVDWERVDLVYVPSHGDLQCPICLFTPTVPKITRCGHVYCWSCLLHYLHLEEKPWRKCPICYEAVHVKDLKSAIVCPMKKYSRKDTIAMRLMRRKKGSLSAYPVHDSAEEPEVDFPIWKESMVQESSVLPSSKLQLISAENVQTNIIARERRELQQLLEEATHEKTGEECYIEIALAQIKEQLELLQLTTNLKELKKSKRKEDKFVEEVSDEVKSPVTDMLNQPQDEDVTAFSDDDGDDDTAEITMVTTPDDISPEIGACAALEQPDLDVEQIAVKSAVNNADQDYYYFYQAADGQSIFIHPLNVRCLVDEYGSLEQSPLTITGQILDFDNFTMTTVLRKRFRYLSHVPVCGEFVMAELLLRAPVLSHRTIRSFNSEFTKRKQARARKHDEQRRFDVKAAQANQAYDGFAAFRDEAPVYAELDMEDFPTDFSPPETPAGSRHTSESVDDLEQSVSGPDEAAGGPSFAQMLKCKQTSTAVKPTHTPRPVWNRADKSLSSRVLPSSSSSLLVGSDAEEESETPASFRDMFSSALLATPITTAQPQHTPDKDGKKKNNRKKNKGQLLFATTAQRKY